MSRYYPSHIFHFVTFTRCIQLAWTPAYCRWLSSSNKSECFQDILCRLIDTIEILRLPLKIGNWTVLWKLLFCPSLCHFSVLYLLKKMNLRVQMPSCRPVHFPLAFSQSLSVNSLGWRIVRRFPLVGPWPRILACIHFCDTRGWRRKNKGPVASPLLWLFPRSLHERRPAIG